MVVFTASDNQVKVVEKSVPTTTEVTTEEQDKKEVSDEEVIVITADVSQMAREIKSKSNREDEEKEDSDVKKEYKSVVASFYGQYFQGKTTANGETFDMNDLTAAHKTLPLGTVAKITNLENNKSVIVRINDRGPYIEGREIDLSQSSFAKIGKLGKGLLKVNIEVLELGNNKYVSSK